MKSTKVELVTLLLERQKAAQKRSHNLAYVIERARKGKYHDWESDLDTPKVALVNDLRAVRNIDLSDVVQRTIDGEWDEDPTPEQLEELRQEVGPEVYDKIMGEKRGSA